VAAPVLAGFTLASITLLVTTDQKNLPAQHEPALWSFVMATGLLIWSVQVGALARDRSRKTIYAAAGIYSGGILALLAALGFLFWPGPGEGSWARIALVVALGAIIFVGTVVVGVREYYWRDLRSWFAAVRGLSGSGRTDREPGPTPR
jgi:hypothetical protein